MFPKAFHCNIHMNKGNKILTGSILLTVMLIDAIEKVE